MDGFSRRTAQKKSAILKAAKTKLAEESYKRDTIKDIAGQAAVSQVTIYNYFGSKDELLYAVLLEMMDKQLEKYGEMLEGTGDYPKLVSKIMLEETAFVKVIKAYVEQSADEGMIWDRILQYQDSKLAPFLIKLVKKGMDEGMIANDLSEMELLVYFNMYQKQMISVSAAQDSSQPQGFISEERLLRFFFYGIAGQNPTFF